VPRARSRRAFEAWLSRAGNPSCRRKSVMGPSAISRSGRPYEDHKFTWLHLSARRSLSAGRFPDGRREESGGPCQRPRSHPAHHLLLTEQALCRSLDPNVKISPPGARRCVTAVRACRPTPAKRERSRRFPRTDPRHPQTLTTLEKYVPFECEPGLPFRRHRGSRKTAFSGPL